MHNDISIEQGKLSYTIGRSEDNDIYLNSPQVSKFHAQINVIGKNQIEIEDLDSKYGTLVNGRRVKRAALNDRDRIVIGIFEFVVQSGFEGLSLKFPTKKPESNFIAEYDLSRHTSLLIGRGKNCTVMVDSQQVSRIHSRIEKSGDEYVVIDLGSTNGTFVNGKRTEKRVLKNKDIIQVGPIRFLFLDGKIYQLNERDFVRIDIVNVSKTSKDTEILRDISLSVLPREFVGILGPSGSGKSTLLNIMNGNVRPGLGTVSLNNTDFNKNYQSFKNLVGFVPQEDIVHPELSVYKTLFYAASLRLPEDMSEEEKNKRVEKILTILELDERRNHPIHRLSGGQKKRVNLGVELLTEPSILFLDEPVSGLDPGLEQKMMQLFRRIADNGQTVIMATHLLNEIKLFDLVALIFDGDLVYYGPPSELANYFKVEKPNDVYNRLYFPPEDGWVKRFKTSIFYKDYVLSRLKTGRETAAKSDKGDYQEFESMVFFNQTYSPFRQFKILAKRYLDIIFHDKINVLILLGQAPIIAALFILVFMNYRNVWSLLFCFSLAAVWFGCINSVREITKEKHIYARERVVSLKVAPYIFSKVFVLFMLCLIQCIMLILITTWKVKVEGSLLLMFLTVFVSSIAGLTMGLLVSAMVSTTDKALAVLPILLIPQILFSGTVVDIDNMIPVSQVVSNFMILRWSYDLLKKISVWESGSFTPDADFFILLSFIPVFILLSFYFQKRKDIRQ